MRYSGILVDKLRKTTKNLIVLTLKLQESVFCDVSCHSTTISLSVQKASKLHAEAKYLISMAMDIFKFVGFLE